MEYYFGLFGGCSSASPRLECFESSSVLQAASCVLSPLWRLASVASPRCVCVWRALLFIFCTRTSLHHTRIGLSFTRTLACAAFRQAWRSVHFPRGCRGRRWCICAAPERLPIVCAMLAPGLSVHESSRSGDDELDGFEARWEGDDHELDGFEPRQTEEMYLLPSWR